MEVLLLVLVGLLTLGVGLFVLNLLYITFILFKFHQTYRSSMTTLNEKIDSLATVYITENEKLARWIREVVVNNS